MKRFLIIVQNQLTATNSHYIRYRLKTTLKVISKMGSEPLGSVRIRTVRYSGGHARKDNTKQCATGPRVAAER